MQPMDSAQNLTFFTYLGPFMKLSTALAIELGGGRAAYLTSHILVSNTIEKKPSHFVVLVVLMPRRIR